MNTIKWYVCAVAFACLWSHSATAKSNSYERDAQKHSVEKAQEQSHTFEGDRTYRKYGASKKELQVAAKNPNGRHFTTSVKGRPPTSESAKDGVGLQKKPKFMLMARATDLMVDGKGHDKAYGGRSNVPEVRVAEKNQAELYKVRIQKLHQKKSPQ